MILNLSICLQCSALSALTLLAGWQEGHPACKKTGWSGAGVVICLERGADLHTAQLMPLPHTVSCFSKIQIGFTFLVPAHRGSPGQRAVKRVMILNSLPLVSASETKVKRRVETSYHPGGSKTKCPPADGSSTRGRSTSVHGRVCSPHMAKLQAASVPIA